MAYASDSWAGRKLSSVLDELRSAGLPLLYSSQIVSNDLVITHDPDAVLQLERLQQALNALGLAIQPLQPASAGYVIVRATPPASDVTFASSAAVPNALPLEEITVFASRYALTRNDSVDRTTLPHASLEKTAGIEQDVLRSVQYLPGTSSNGLTALAHVRGGYEDETLVRFDGVELFKPVHLKDFQGLFGLLDPDWVQSLNFYSGAFPVQFGNHSAAVLDITPRSTADAQYTIGTSLLYSRVLSTGSYDNQAGHWLLGYRRSNVSEVMRHSEKNIGEPEFEDFILRNSYQFGGGELKLGALRLNDDLELQTDLRDQQAQAHDHDSYVWLGWQHDWSDALHYDLQLSHTQLSSRRSAVLQRANISNGQLRDQHDARLYTLDTHFSWQSPASDASDDNTDRAVSGWGLNWGLHVNHGSARYQYAATASYATPLNTAFNQPVQLQQQYQAAFTEPDYAAFIGMHQQWGALRAELGVRQDWFPYLPHGHQLSPRLNLQYSLTPTGTLHLSAGQYVQAQTLHMLDTSQQAPMFAAPERMRQYILGWTQGVTQGLQLRIEAYDKRGSRIRTRSENLLSFITLASELEIDRTTVSATHSRARGLEISLSPLSAQHFNWWLNYSWSSVQDQIAGQYVRRAWDQPHTITAGMNWTTARWLLAASTSWHSGWAYTPLLVDGNGVAILGARNSARVDDFASLELRAQYTLPVKAAELLLFAELRNALNRNNECCRELSVSTAGRISIDSISGLRLIPVLGATLKF